MSSDNRVKSKVVPTRVCIPRPLPSTQYTHTHIQTQKGLVCDEKNTDLEAVCFHKCVVTLVIHKVALAMKHLNPKGLRAMAWCTTAGGGERGCAFMGRGERENKTKQGQHVGTAVVVTDKCP